MVKFLAIMGLAALAFVTVMPLENLPDISNRIFGGMDATIEQVPYQVKLHFDSWHVCGGSIISEYWVLTAAHCADDGDRSRYVVRAGSSGSSNKGFSSHLVSLIIIHPEYESTNLSISNNDIALIRIANPFLLDETRKVIELFNAGEEAPVGAKAIVSGWGLNELSQSPSILQMVQLFIVSKEECSETYSEQGGLQGCKICAGVREGGKDTCFGDSGGPLAIDGRLAGITSWGRGCGELGFPGVYTEVAAYRDWIKNHTGI